ncbi:MAG: hypothetical protein MUO24_04900 [Desulfobacterales bacterium]|nr:hypothetical protein [Desulfobacterales bacterium]
MDNDIKAKVFISCGQRKKSEGAKVDEVEIAHEVASVLESMGYGEPYIAVYDRSLRGLKENIFSHLETSEYFLFIDLCREKLDDSNDRRGSLFCNQELAIASYLELEAIGFQQKGVMRDGILEFIQLIQSHHKFDDPKELPEMVRKEVKKHWRPDWKNALRISKDSIYSNDTTLRARGDKAKYFHVIVENLHKRKIALGCTAYIESIRDLQTQNQVPLETVELKWDGYTLPNASIMPQPNVGRGLTLFFVLHQRPNELHFDNFTDSTRFMQPLCGPGDYELTYVVITQNFPIVRTTFTVHIENQLDRITFA